MAVYLGENQVGVYGGPVPPGSDKVKIQIQCPNNSDKAWFLVYLYDYVSSMSTCLASGFLNRDLYVPPTKDGKGLLFVYTTVSNYTIGVASGSTNATKINTGTPAVIECEPNTTVILDVYYNH